MLGWDAEGDYAWMWMWQLCCAGSAGCPAPGLRVHLGALTLEGCPAAGFPHLAAGSAGCPAPGLRVHLGALTLEGCPAAGFPHPAACYNHLGSLYSYQCLGPTLHQSRSVLGTRHGSFLRSVWVITIYRKSWELLSLGEAGQQINCLQNWQWQKNRDETSGKAGAERKNQCEGGGHDGFQTKKLKDAHILSKVGKRAGVLLFPTVWDTTKELGYCWNSLSIGDP